MYLTPPSQQRSQIRPLCSQLMCSLLPNCCSLSCTPAVTSLGLYSPPNPLQQRANTLLFIEYCLLIRVFTTMILSANFPHKPSSQYSAGIRRAAIYYTNYTQVWNYSEKKGDFQPSWWDWPLHWKRRDQLRNYMSLRTSVCQEMQEPFKAYSFHLA